MSWADERRADQAAKREQDRLDADAASARRISERNALAAQQRKDQATRLEQQRKDSDERQARRARRLKAIRAWFGAHRVDLLVYPLAVASAVMAIPSMAAYGAKVYGNTTGMVLPVLSELGMWAFALAVQLARRDSEDRPVWALRLGVWLFAGVAFALNVLHGQERGYDAGIVMGVASVAGVFAHQLVTAPPRRSRAERDTARAARRETRKLAQVRRAAVRHAVAEITSDGRARLVYAPGRYRLNWRGRDLEPATAAGLPEPDPIEREIDAAMVDLDRELIEVLTLDSPSTGDRSEQGDDTLGGGSIATLEPPREPTPESGSTPPSGQRKSRPKWHREPAKQNRTIDDLRADLRSRLERSPESIDPTSAESIRKALRCSPKNARRLRDEHRDGTT